MKPTIGAMEDDCEDDRDEFFDAISTPDSDTDSIFSDSEDLKEVLSEALRTDAPFTGSHHYCLTEQSAPNPFLRVAGLGPLELPLSEGDARSIASVASPVRAAEDQTANNVWEVGPSDLMVEGAAWQGYLNNAVLPSVSDELGFSSFTNSKARIELSKLMLFGPGSSSEAANEFGKLAVFLRSAFEGGQIRLSSTGENDAVKIDVSSVSKTSTTFIAWYNDDVVSRIMPVTSGYQLVLVYCLVHTGSPFTEPTLRYATDRSTFLGHVLTRWREKDYQHLPSVPLLVLPLSKAYEPQSLKDGTDTLEDLDAETVASLLPVAQNHSFSVCLANFVPSALETGQQAYIVFNFVRIKDASDPDRTLYLKELGIPHDALTCDEANGETYADRSVRTGLVIFQDQDELDIAILHQGAEQTLKSLTTREPLRPTARNRQLARAALKSLGKIGQQGHDASGRECSWATAPSGLVCMSNGFPTFGASLIKDSVYDLIIRISNISGRLMLIEAIVPLLPNDEVGLSWANGAVGVVLSSYRDGKVEDIPTLLDLAAQHGLAPIHEKSGHFERIRVGRAIPGCFQLFA
ncbi:hypothetical protein EST38_g8637 [Candolleomyces aberdarensis]|uniref:Uncharacterized protein n=1 Tax=Candolleomyces aberdarensis TaxID=2316362 RepID=A0A4Q2DCS5_9AGAR|nr:hypothetical protein EST38_g8637 [Candolleomyces aberdarensis]